MRALTSSINFPARFDKELTRRTDAVGVLLCPHLVPTSPLPARKDPAPTCRTYDRALSPHERSGLVFIDRVLKEE